MIRFESWQENPAELRAQAVRVTGGSVAYGYGWLSDFVS